MSENHSHRPPSFDGEADASRLQESWNALGVPDVDGAWNELQDRLRRSDAGAAGSHVHRSPVPWLRVAAAALLVVGAGIAGWNVPVVVEAAPGQQRTVQLPDGSAVQLNAGSSLRHPRGFSWLPGVARGGRRVVLRGEAWFDVATDGRPFEVSAADARIRVLGTAFLVRTRQREHGRGRPGPAPGRVRVVVTEGRVAVAAPDGNEVRLAAGEGARWDPLAGLETSEPSLRHELAWRSGGFAAVDAPLGDVLHEAGLRFGVTVEVAPEVPVDERVTVYYGGEVDLERVLADLVTARGLQYRPTATGWQVGP
jgi:ferric-dicitrate binding protein FerR (iron transport regulator)